MRSARIAGAIALGHHARSRRDRLRMAALLAAFAVLAAGCISGTGAQPGQAAGPPAAAVAAAPPAGFAKTQLAHGLTKPTAFAFAPNGDIYLAEQTGPILIYRGGTALPNPVVTLNTDGTQERGVLGIALDPSFATNGFLYVSYTTVDDHALLSRLTVHNDTAALASEKVLFRGNQLQNPHHGANDLHVGPDGKLWWSVGDNVPSISNAQALTNIYGKILRFNLDGSIPADNPFVNVPGANPAIYAYGLRNPFRFGFLPDGRAITEDTGSSYWEELNVIQRGGNYGWHFYEGNCFSCGYINPVYAYGHLPTDGAVSAIAPYAGSVFPKAYGNVVFFGDYNRRDIEAVTFDPTYGTEINDTVFDPAAGTIADLQEGPDGNLYYVSIFEGTFTKISAPGPFAPTAAAAATPSAGLAPLTVQLSSAGSQGPFGGPLTYSWDFGDGSPVSTAANPSHQYSQNGTFTATVTVGSGGQTSQASTKVVVGHAPPTGSITSPPANATYTAGSTVGFSGTATDPVDGTLPASAYTWQVDFITNGVAQPFYTAEVPHPFFGPAGGVTSGSFQIPPDASNTPSSFYRITLSTVNSSGVATTTTRDIHPVVTTWSADTNVPGAAYVVDGALRTGPSTTSDVIGVRHVFAGLPTQVVNGTRYRFRGWSDGRALTESFTTIAGAPTHVALYDPVGTTVPPTWQSLDVGTPLMAGTADYSPSTQTFYVDGAGADNYGVNDQFHYVDQALNGDGTIVARVRYQTNSSPWTKAGVMIKQFTTAGSNYVDALVTPDVSSSTPNVNGTGCVFPANAPGAGCTSPLPPVTPTVGNGVRMQYDFNGSRAVTSPAALAGYASPNKWLKLQRKGNTFTSWYSVDGVSWVQIGSTTVAMNGPVTIGLFVTSHNIGQYSSAAFDNVSLSTGTTTHPVPPPWSDTDVGAPTVAGSADFTSGVFTVNGAGTDIYGTNDQFNYVNQLTTGNGTLVARVTSQTNTSANAKAGIIWKQSTTAGSPYILVAVGPGGIKVQYNFNQSVNGGTFTFPNGWLKLTRLANTFTASVSADGVGWTTVASVSLALTASATAGLFVCSHNPPTIGTATFDNVAFTPGP